MTRPTDARLLRILIGEDDRHGGRPLYEVIVERARARGLAGASVFRGVLGYGARSLIHTAKILRLSEDLPLVIEIVDSAERIEGFLPELDGLMQDGVVTFEKVGAIVYRDGEPVDRSAP